MKSKLVRESVFKGPSKEEILRHLKFEVKENFLYEDKYKLEVYWDGKQLRMEQLVDLLGRIDVPGLEARVIEEETGKFPDEDKDYKISAFYAGKEVTNVPIAGLLNSDILNEYYEKNKKIVEAYLMKLNKIKDIKKIKEGIDIEVPRMLRAYASNQKYYDLMVPEYERALQKIDELTFKIYHHLKNKDLRYIEEFFVYDQLEDTIQFVKLSDDHKDKIRDLIYKKFKNLEPGDKMDFDHFVSTLIGREL